MQNPVEERWIIKSELPILEFADIAFRYPGQADWLLRDLSLRLGPGERVAVVADNGLGKSTLVYLALGLERPHQGTVRLAGRQPRECDHLPGVAFVGDPSRTEGTPPLPPDLPIGKLVDQFRDIHRHSDWPLLHDAELVRELGLDAPALLRRTFVQLNKGHRQRVQLWLALVKRPWLVLADEPAEGLDHQTRAFIPRAFRRASEVAGAAVLYVTHHLEELLALDARVYRLTDQRLVSVEDGPLEGVLSVDGERRPFRGLGRQEALALLTKPLLDPTTAEIHFEAHRERKE